MIRVVDLNKENERFDECVIGLGNFDGIHFGHREIIKHVVKTAKERGLKSSVLVFKQHTNEVFPKFPPYYISSLQDKIDILDSLGVDVAYTIDFTMEFAQLSIEGFILDFIVDRLNAKVLVCGQDYTYGKGSKGTVIELFDFQNRGLLEVDVVEEVLYHGRKISSTEIRNGILDGNFKLVKDLLSENYVIRGTVEHGYNRGTKLLGFPTANLKFSFNYILPKDALYITYFIVDGVKYKGLTSIGTNPTFTDSKEVKVETFILDFDKDLYGKEVKIEFLKLLRDQIKFDGPEGLIEQMNKDVVNARKYFAEIE